jgi:hypothetical protein
VLGMAAHPPTASHEQLTMSVLGEYVQIGHLWCLSGATLADRFAVWGL